jgi:hypothetical protein
MNVLRFPIQLRTGKNQFMRAERLKEQEEGNETMLEENENSIENETTVLGKFLLSINEILKIKLFRWC